MGQAAPLTLSDGASSSTETFGDWQVVCSQQPQGPTCEMVQQQLDPQTQSRLLSAEFRLNADNLVGILVLPFGLELDRGVTLEADGVKFPQPDHYLTCLPVGCIVPLQLDPGHAVALGRAKSLHLLVSTETGNNLTLSLSLRGFADAIAKLATPDEQ